MAAVAQLMRATRHLDLSHNRLREAEVQVLAAGLQRSRSLTQLYVHGNGIEVQGGRMISEALLVNQSLTELRLDESTPLSIPTLKGTEDVTQPLDVIDLSARSLGVASVIVVATLVATNVHVTQLSLLGNRIPPQVKVQ